jgi:hypothetical protein
MTDDRRRMTEDGGRCDGASTGLLSDFYFLLSTFPRVDSDWAGYRPVNSQADSR